LDHTKQYFRFFEEISRIPRESGNEAQVTEYLVAFAEARGLRIHRDGMNNLVMFKPASPGFEDAEPVILQAHTDMVCVKRDGVVHDFSVDPLDLTIEDGWLHANGTSLGADDACGVAAMLYILDDASVRHPALECLFTVEEETGMLGAAQFDFSILTGRRLVGLDSKDENECLVATAGGRRFTLNRSTQTDAYAGAALEISVEGLVGGHPGVEIGNGRGNAIRALARVLDAVRRSGIEFRVAEIHGGEKGNAIPYSCQTTVVVPAEDRARAVGAIARAAEAQISQRSFTDPAMSIRHRELDGSFSLLSSADSSELCDALLLLPSGVIQMSAVFEGAVQTSTNIAAVHVEDGHSSIIVSVRSSVEAQLDDVSADVERVARRCGFEAEAGAAHPAFPFREVSPFRDLYAEVMQEEWGVGLDMIAAHAGVELAYFAKNIPDIEAVALGPNITGAHTYDESMEIASFERVCLFLAAFLGRLRADVAPQSVGTVSPSR
jgi:dipeptidase D